MSEHLFVYGTLAPGAANAWVLAPIAGTWQPARVRGSLVDAGWAAAQGYPGLVLDAGERMVAGQLFSSDQLCAHWPRLDAFEGAGYRRVLTRALRDDGGWVDAFVYVVVHTV